MPFSWVTALWSAAIAACLTLALVSLFIWLRDRSSRSHLLFATASVVIAFVGVFELVLMRVTSPERMAFHLRWAHVVFFALFAALVGFVRSYLDAGRPWLAWAAVGTRAFASLVLNFSSPGSLSYAAVERTIPLRFLGETVSVAGGIPNPWVRVGELSNVLFLAFLVDAGVEVWRRGDRRRALTICGSVAFFMAVTATHAALLHAGRIRSPYFVTFAYLGILLAMGQELGGDVIRSRRLACPVCRATGAGSFPAWWSCPLELGSPRPLRFRG